MLHTGAAGLLELRCDMKRLAEGLYFFLKQRHWIQTERIRQVFSRLQPGTVRQTEEAVDLYYIHLIKRSIVLFVLVVSVSGLLLVRQAAESGQGIHLTRSDYGEEEDVYHLVYQDSQQEQQELLITLAPVEYSPDELRDQFRQGFLCLEQALPGENPSLDQITQNLKLLTVIPGSGLSVSWSSDDHELLEENGTVKNEDITKAQQVRLLLELSYGEQTESREYELTILPAVLTGEEEQKRQLRMELEQLLQESRYEREVYLPPAIQGVELREAGSAASRIWIILPVGFGMIGLLWLRQREDLYRRLKQRKQALEQAYPYFVNQLLLYTGAGATVKGALERIIRQLEQKGKGGESLYQELMIMQNETGSGITQEQAYINLGKRIALLPYMKLASLLAQQQRKGAGSLALPLEEEEHLAFERRKERARRAGEEAGTRLLLPMILLMVLSMLVVVCPALMNFM